MDRRSQSGSINPLLLPLVLAVLLLIGAGVFGYWAFTGRQDYKSNVNQKITAAVAAAVKREDAKLNAQFADQAKSPLRSYDGPEQYGTIHLLYPKTWSGYVTVSDGSSTPLDGYFNPSVVPGTSNNNVFALQVQVLQQSYSSVLASYSSQVQQGALKAQPFTLKKVPSDVGTRLTGRLQQNLQGDMILLPLRDKTLAVWTDGQQYENDFNTYILPNLSFSP